MDDPGLAHVFAMWGFIILLLTIIETFGATFVAQDFAIPVIGRWAVIGFIEDLFAVLVLVGLAIFAIIRLRTQPAKQGRYSRFFGSHTGAAWFTLFMIFNVIWTLLVYRGAHYNVASTRCRRANTSRRSRSTPPVAHSPVNSWRPALPARQASTRCSKPRSC